MATALKPDGRLVTVAITTGDDAPADDPVPYLFSVLMLAWTHEGEVHPASGYADAVREAGFAEPRQLTVPHNPLRVYIADRGGAR